MFVYSIYDKKACCHVTQFFAQNDATAHRTFCHLVNDSRSDICQFPDDFALYCVGEFDINNGALSGFTPVKFIVDGSSLVKAADRSESN